MASFKTIIKKIKNDHNHGSSWLLQEIIVVFTTAKYSDSEILWSFAELAKIDSSMLVIHHFLEELKPAIGNDFQHKLAQYLNTWKNVNENITTCLKGHLPSDTLSVLTHSHSGAVIGAIQNLLKTGYSINVMQTESIPGGEGKIQAKTFRQFGLTVSVVKDDSIINIMSKVNCCLLGVDQYDENSFINKKGSKAIVELAYQANIPVFVLADLRKKVIKIRLGNAELFEIVSLMGNVRILTPEG